MRQVQREGRSIDGRTFDLSALLRDRLDRESVEMDR